MAGIPNQNLNQRSSGTDDRGVRGPKPLWATVVETETGHAAVAASAYGIVACNWHYATEAEATESLLSELRPLLKRGAYQAPSFLSPTEGLPPHLAAARAGLIAFAAGDFNALQALEIDGRARTPFVTRVQRAVQAIPAGRVLSYGEVAAQVGSPGAARAVGQVMATNPLAPVVPCHRVIAANGSLGGFGPGLPAKVALLQREGVRVSLDGVER